MSSVIKRWRNSHTKQLIQIFQEQDLTDVKDWLSECVEMLFWSEDFDREMMQDLGMSLEHRIITNEFVEYRFDQFQISNFGLKG